MKPVDWYEKLIRDLHVLDIDTSDKMDRRILHDTLKVQQELKQTKLASNQPDTWRIIMKSSTTKLAVAVIIVVIGLGIFTFIDTDSSSGTVWAEVAQKVEASTGVIFRSRGTGSRDQNDDWPNGYKITWRSAAVTRTDHYRNGQIRRTIYLNYDAKAKILLAHDAKKYIKEAMSDAQVQRARADKDRWTNPQSLLNCCRSLLLRVLGTGRRRFSGHFVAPRWLVVGTKVS